MVCVYDGVFPNLLLQDAVKYEDEHALQRVKDGEEVRHDHCTLVNIHQAERPGQAQQTEQSDGSDYPRSETHTHSQLALNTQSELITHKCQISGYIGQFLPSSPRRLNITSVKVNSIFSIFFPTHAALYL